MYELNCCLLNIRNRNLANFYEIIKYKVYIYFIFHSYSLTFPDQEQVTVLSADCPDQDECLQTLHSDVKVALNAKFN